MLLAVERIGCPSALGLGPVCPPTGLGVVDRLSKPPPDWLLARSVVFALRVALDDCG